MLKKKGIEKSLHGYFFIEKKYCYFTIKGRRYGLEMDHRLWVMSAACTSTD